MSEIGFVALNKPPVFTSMSKQDISAFVYDLSMGKDLTKYQSMTLCLLLGIEYPPQPNQKGKPAPVTLATH